MRILLAEDDPTTRLLLSKTLQLWGYEVTAAPDGLKAWELLQSGDFRLVLSDWEMPELDGPGLCAQIRGRGGPYVYLILLTSHGETSRVVEGLGAGADDYVSKPFDPSVLRARLSVGRRLLALQDELAARNAELAEANRELERIATTDPLLNIGNRRSFEDVVVHAHQTARRTGRGYAVLIADIDHFKRFNDTHGHAFGDRVLARTAGALQYAVGDEGMLFRYGGEELIAVAPEQTSASLALLAERMRAVVENTRIELPRGTYSSLTVSIGAALFAPEEAISAQVVIDHADASLYHAKQNGRNLVVLWPFEDAMPPRTSQF